METIIAWGTGLISAASVIAAITPTPRDDDFLRSLKKFINLLALNIGKASPKE